MVSRAGGAFCVSAPQTQTQQHAQHSAACKAVCALHSVVCSRSAARRLAAPGRTGRFKRKNTPASLSSAVRGSTALWTRAMILDSSSTCTARPTERQNSNLLTIEDHVGAGMIQPHDQTRWNIVTSRNEMRPVVRVLRKRAQLHNQFQRALRHADKRYASRKRSRVCVVWGWFNNSTRLEFEKSRLALWQSGSPARNRTAVFARHCVYHRASCCTDYCWEHESA